MIQILAIAFFLISVLYASVGFGGGSGYLAAMSIAGVGPDIMRPTAFVLNIIVSSIGTWKFIRAGHFSKRLFWLIASMSIPFAFIGGRLDLPHQIYRPLVGLVLLYAAYRLFRTTTGTKLPAKRPLPTWTALLAGASIGFLAGIIGIGGGIFLSPLVLLAGWADTRETLGISAAFVLANSLAGLSGLLFTIQYLPRGIPLWIAVVILGGWLGAEYGSKRLNPVLLRRLLSLVLIFGGVRMIVG